MEKIEKGKDSVVCARASACRSPTNDRDVGFAGR